MLDVGAKRRLTGAVVLVVLAVVFLPMLLEEDALQDPVPEEELRIPEPPPVERGRQAEIFSGIEDAGSRPKSRPGATPPEPVAEPEPGPEPGGVPTPSQARAEPGDPKEAAGGKPGAAPGAPSIPPILGGKPALAPSPEAEPAKPKPSAGDVAPEKSKPGVPKPVPKGLTSWVVQVAALSTPDAAQKLERELRSSGFHAFVEKIEGPNRTLWRVRVGPEVERTRADALATDVKKRTGLNVYVQKYRDG
jgi:DedD protein